MVRVPKQGYVVWLDNGDGTCELYKQFFGSPFEIYTTRREALVIAEMQNRLGERIGGRTDWEVKPYRIGEDDKQTRRK